MSAEFSGVAWGKSSEGYVTSKGGRFVICPEYYGTSRAQSYSLSDTFLGKDYPGHDTQKSAKYAANSIVIDEFRARAKAEAK